MQSYFFIYSMGGFICIFDLKEYITSKYFCCAYDVNHHQYDRRRFIYLRLTGLVTNQAEKHHHKPVTSQLIGASLHHR